MKRAWASLLCWIIWTVVQADWVEIRNGDSLQATFIGQEGGNTRLRPIWSETSVLVPTRYLNTIRIEGSEAVTFPYLLTLSNGDQVPVEWLGATDETLTVKVPWQAELVLPRRVVLRLESLAGHQIHRAGPGLAKEWTVEQNPFAQRGEGPVLSDSPKGVVVQGMGALQRKLPEMEGARVLTVEVDQPGEMFQALNISWEGVLEMQGQPFIQTLHISQRSIYYRMMLQTGQAANSWRMNLPDLHLFEKLPYRMEVGMDPNARLFRLSVNGQFLHEWNAPDAAAFQKEGGMSLRLENRFGDAIWSVVRADLRQGTLGKSWPAEGSDSGANLDRVMLRNGDRLAGKVHQYVDGNVWLAIEGRPDPIPLAMARVSGIFFDSSPKTVPRRYARDVRVTAHAGMTRVTGRLSEANEMSLDLQSEIWGELRSFPMSDVELIQFNPYLPTETVWQKPSQPLPHLP